MKKIILLLPLLFFLLPSFSQNYKVIDSLRKTLSQQKAQDTNTVIRYRQLANNYGWNAPDSSIYFYNRAIELSRKLHFTKGEFWALNNVAFVLAVVRSDSAAVSSAYNAIEIAEDEKNPKYLSNAYISLGSVYMHLKEFKKGLFYHQKALNYLESKDSFLVYACYEHFAQCFIGLREVDSAFLYATKVLVYNEQHKIENAWDVYQMGSVYFQKGNMDSALKYYKNALLIENPNRYTYKKNFADYNIGIANVFKQKNVPSSVIYYAKKAYGVSGSIGLSNEKLEALNLLISAFTSQLKIDSAFTYQQFALALRDSIYNADKVRQVQLLSFNEDLRKQQEAEQERKRLNSILLYSLLAALLFTLIVVALIYRNNQHRQKAYALLQKQKLELDTQKQKAELALNELKVTQSQLIQSEKMASLGELTAGIAHEIQNPLNFVNNFSEVSTELLEELKGERSKVNGERDEEFEVEIMNDLTKNLQKINDHGKRADAIVKGMLQHSRANTGKKEPTDINALAEEYLRLAYHGLRAKDKDFNSDFTTNFDERIGKIEVVPQDIGRVLLNLYNNAFYAVSEKKRQLNGTFEPAVTVTTKRTGDRVEIVVKDNGNGIPQKIVYKIFHPFFTTKPTGQGTGLGLSLSYDIVKAHSGEVRVESEEGEGAEFTIHLPLKEVN